MAYSSFDDFWSYYIGEVEKKIPADTWKSFLEVQAIVKKTKNKKPEQITPEEAHAHIIYGVLLKKIHGSFKKLTDIEVGELNFFIRTSVKFPKKIALVYRPELDTYASWYNPDKKQFEILYPTISIYFKKFPEPLKAGIMHELGHIINGDSLVKKDMIHAQCMNIAMDARINMHLDYQMLGYLTRCLVFDKDEGYFVSPEEWYPSIGLPVTPGGYSWDFAHEQYHFFDSPYPKNPQLPQKSGGQPLTQEEAEQIMGSFSPDQIQEGEGGEGEPQEGEGSGKQQEADKAGKKASQSKSKAGDSQDKADEAKSKAQEAAENAEQQAKEHGEDSPEAKQAREEAKKAQAEAKAAQDAADKAKAEAEKAAQEAEAKKAEAEKEAKAKGEAKPGETDEKGKFDPIKNSRRNKGLLKQIDKTIGTLNKIKEKYA